MSDMVKAYEEHVKSIPGITEAREAELSRAINGEDRGARDMAICELVNGNLRRVLSVTKRYRSYPDYLDLVFDGNLGLVRAATDFDIKKGRFSTHATQRIRTAIREGIRDRLGSAYVPRTTIAMVKRIRDAIGSSEKTDEELSAELVVDIHDVVSARLAMLAMLDAIPIFDENGEELEIPDHKAEEMFDDMHKQDLLRLVNRAAKELGLTKDELLLVSNMHDHGRLSVATRMAKELGLTPQALRCRRTRLVWEIRRRILTYVGGKEYLVLSAIGRLPANCWKDERVNS